MHAINLVKQEFLKMWMSGLTKCDSSAKMMNVIERKNAIKLSADIAMAGARRGVTCWSRAIIAQAPSTSSNSTRKLLARQILNKARYRRDKLIISSQTTTNTIPRSSDTILRKRRICIMRRKMGKRRNLGSCLKKRAVKKRADMLKSLVPGGALMDDKCLIRETLDYIVYLRAQVEVMRAVAADSAGGGGACRNPCEQRPPE